MQKHPLYCLAKEGEPNAAANLIEELFPSYTLFRKFEGYVCPVMRSSGNAIPLAFAKSFCPLAAEINSDIILQNFRTGNSLVSRLFYSPEYAGKVSQGNYIIVDDVFTTGKTLISLKNYIEANGGNVIACVTIGSGRWGLSFQPDRFTLNLLLNTFKDINSYFDIASLTIPMIRFMMRYDSLWSLQMSYSKQISEQGIF